MGCEKKASVVSEVESNNHSVSDLEQKETPKAVWYEFYTDNSNSAITLKKISKPASSDEFKPWTEAITVSGLGLMYNPPILLVNKAGIISFSDSSVSKPYLLTFKSLQDRTIDGFYASEEGSLIRSYINSIFSSEPILYSENKAFLCRYNPISEEIIPICFPADFNLPKYAQCTHLEKINGMWYASFKIETDNQVDFKFFKFSSIDKITLKNYSKISKTEFQNALKPVIINAGKEYSDYILNTISMGFADFFKSSEIKKVNLTVFSSKDLSCEKRFVVKNPNAKSEYDEINANSLLSYNDNDLITLFETGNMFFFTADSENNFAVKNLPNLPEGFDYSYFFVTDNKVVATWNENRFFEIGKSGILSYMLN